MTEPNPPLWVYKRDGSQAAFDADRISRALFAAGEALGRPDAFEARELADGVVHFLARDCEGRIPTTMRIAEVVEQVVRELGRPELARAFAEHAPGQAGESTASAAELMGQSRRAAGAYTRDLEAAGAAGLLILPDCEPDLLAGGVLGPPENDLLRDLQLLRRRVGRWAALDGLEERAAAATPREVVDLLAKGLAQTQLSAAVNLNLAAPSWAGPIATGPLFAGSDPPSDPRRRQALADELLAEILPRLGTDLAAVSVNWHLGARDFEDDNKDRLLRILEHARPARLWTFTFDRRRPLVLGFGLDRQHPAVLCEVGLNLPALSQQAGLLADPARFSQRLGTLVRLALSAARQKQARVRQADLRRQSLDPASPPLTSGFLLDRARFVVVPVGLDEVVTQFTGWSMSTGGESLDFGRGVVRQLREVLEHDGPRVQLQDCILDGPSEFCFGAAGLPPCATVAGQTPWDAQASLRRQVQAATALWGAADAGVLALFVAPEAPAEQLRGALHELWRQSHVSRVRLLA